MVGLTAERNMQKTAPVDDIPRLVEGAVFINRLHAVASAFEYLFGYVPDVAMQLKWKGNLSMKKNPVLILAAFAVMLAACNSTVTSKETKMQLIQQNEIFLTPPGMAVAITREDCTAVEVASGTQVMWINADTEELAITIERLDASGAVTDTEDYDVQPTAFMTKVFNEPATYRYTCSEDMDWYSTITVKE